MSGEGGQLSMGANGESFEDGDDKDSINDL